MVPALIDRKPFPRPPKHSGCVMDASNLTPRLDRLSWYTSGFQ